MAAPQNLRELLDRLPAAFALVSGASAGRCRLYVDSVLAARDGETRLDGSAVLVARTATVQWDRFLLDHFSSGAPAADAYERAELADVVGGLRDALAVALQAAGSPNPELFAAERSVARSDPAARAAVRGSAALRADRETGRLISLLDLDQRDVRIRSAEPPPHRWAAEAAAMSHVVASLAEAAGIDRRSALDLVADAGGGMLGLWQLCGLAAAGTAGSRFRAQTEAFIELRRAVEGPLAQIPDRPAADREHARRVGDLLGRHAAMGVARVGALAGTPARPTRGAEPPQRTL